MNDAVEARGVLRDGWSEGKAAPRLWLFVAETCFRAVRKTSKAVMFGCLLAVRPPSHCTSSIGATIVPSGMRNLRPSLS